MELYIGSGVLFSCSYSDPPEIRTETIASSPTPTGEGGEAGRPEQGGQNLI
jgi:hypothetical protein